MSLTLGDEDDFWAQDDLDLDREAFGIDALINSIYRRFGTPRGSLPSPVDPPDPADADAGTDLYELLALGQTAAGAFAVQSAVKAEVLKETSVDPDSVGVGVSLDLSTIPNTATIAITGKGINGQAFALTLQIAGLSSSQGTVLLLSSGATQ